MTTGDPSQNKISTIIVLAIVLMFMLSMCSGCSTTVPVTAKFPEPPGLSATTACADLKKISDGPTLSEVTKTVVINYGTYHECAVKVNAWNEWYQIQKHIFENLVP